MTVSSASPVSAASAASPTAPASLASPGPSLVWFRRDLRLADHPALLAAQESGGVLGVFVADDELLQPSGAPRRSFLAGCLRALDESTGGNLLVVHGRPETVLPRLAAAVGAGSVHVSADFMPYGRARDERVAAALTRRGVEFVATGSPYAVAPGRIRRGDGSPYLVFTPFFRAWQQHGWRGPAGSGDGVPWTDPDAAAGEAGVHRYPVERIDVRPPAGMTLPDPGELAARARWADFRDGALERYADDRNRPDRAATSRLSPYLKWGCIHPRTLLADLADRHGASADSYRSELAWREFYADTVFRAPESLRTSLDPAIDRMQRDTGAVAADHLQAWKDGRTGYPFVDAGMRQLLADGWMHNRVRMVVASFLIKDLHLPWQDGARHFLDHLVDADVASNNHGWQWVAGSGPGSAKFYRIFNPVTQGETFDPSGDYVRRYVPELRGIPGKAVHQPWERSGGLPAGYPARIVDHKAEREEALRRFAALSG